MEALSEALRPMLLASIEAMEREADSVGLADAVYLFREVYQAAQDALDRVDRKL